MQRMWKEFQFEIVFQQCFNVLMECSLITATVVSMINLNNVIKCLKVVKNVKTVIIFGINSKHVIL